MTLDIDAANGLAESDSRIGTGASLRRWRLGVGTLLAVLSVQTVAIAYPLAERFPAFVFGAFGISVFFALVVFGLRAATGAGAACGALACLLLTIWTGSYPGSLLRTGLTPLILLFLLTFIATRMGRHRKTKAGLAEKERQECSPGDRESWRARSIFFADGNGRSTGLVAAYAAWSRCPGTSRRCGCFGCAGRGYSRYGFVGDRAGIRRPSPNVDDATQSRTRNRRSREPDGNRSRRRGGCGGSLGRMVGLAARDLRSFNRTAGGMCGTVL